MKDLLEAATVVLIDEGSDASKIARDLYDKYKNNELAHSIAAQWMQLILTKGKGKKPSKSSYSSGDAGNMDPGKHSGPSSGW